MLVFHKKRHGINFYTVWFAQRPFNKKGIIFYREYMGDTEAENRVPFETLLTDLTESEENIKQHFSKNCKYEVNRGMRENIIVEISEGKSITNELIEEFCVFFKCFWESKGIEYKGINKLHEELLSYRNLGALTLAFACVEGEKAVYHTYITDEDRVRLWHSASLYRLHGDEEGKQRALIGMANRFMHFEEMKYFKQSGRKEYDWGGAGLSEDVQAITKFKKSFGGCPATYYNFEQINGISAKLFKRISKFIKK